MGQRELQECFDLKAGSLSEILSKLECAGLIERTRAEGDRRQLVVRLTETGWAMAEEDRRDRELFERTAFSPLSPAEQEQLLGMLTKIQRHWESNDD
jgi:DNA-binding MarR family transcriptional regulator